MTRIRLVYRPGHAHANERGFVDVAMLDDVLTPETLPVFGEGIEECVRSGVVDLAGQAEEACDTGHHYERAEVLVDCVVEVTRAFKLWREHASHLRH